MSKNLGELGCRFICFILGKQPKGRVAMSRSFLDLDGLFFLHVCKDWQHVLEGFWKG